jgi:hypothetical protein
MAYMKLRHEFVDEYILASNVLATQGQGVRLNGGVVDSVVPVTSAASEPHGALLGLASQGDSVGVYGRGQIVKMTAGASLGFGANVNYNGATNGVTLVASGSWRIGKLLANAVAGDVVPVHVDPVQLVA